MGLLYIYSKIINHLRGKAIRNSVIHPSAFVGNGCNIIKLQMGRYSYIGHDSEVLYSEIGSFCSISDHVYIGGAEHPMDWVSTSPVFQNVRHSGPTKRFSKFDLPPLKKTVIGNDVWIGHGVTIKQGVTIGNGAVIGSNSLVTKDVPPYAVIGGVPAKIIKYRFDEDTIAALLKSEWWNWSDEKIFEFAHLIKDPSEFIGRV